MFKIAQTDSLHDRMFEFSNYSRKSGSVSFPTSFAVILSAVALPIVLKAEFNFELITVHYHFCFLKSRQLR